MVGGAGAAAPGLIFGLGDMGGVPRAKHLAQNKVGEEILSLRDNATAYQRKVAACIEAIERGETYQVCLTTEAVGKANAEPLAIYEALREKNPAPFSAYIRCCDISLLCSSMERFLSVDEEGCVKASPIKGTRARSTDPSTDERFAQDLAKSEKDRAENIMIVDLMRSDLAKVCEPGSINVAALCKIESYPRVHQMVSTVEGNLRPDKDGIDLVKAAFPGGSMTGAPKLRTMEIIDDLERRPRGVYSGAVGWFGFDGQLDLNIVIRTALYNAESISVAAGGGVVGLSSPEAEFDEMIVKARSVTKALGWRLNE